MKKILAVSTAILVSVITFGDASAHHSHANYEAIKWTDISGKVSEVQWLNPHVWVYVTSQEGKEWALEGGSPAALIRGGWKKESVKIGDNINVKCHIAKDGSNNCLLGFLTTPGGAPKEFD